MIAIHRPLQGRINDCDITSLPHAESAGIQPQQTCWIERVQFDEPVQIDHLSFVNKDVDEETELRFQSKDSEGRLVKFHFLFKGAMGRVVTR